MSYPHAQTVYAEEKLDVDEAKPIRELINSKIDSVAAIKIFRLMFAKALADGAEFTKPVSPTNIAYFTTLSAASECAQDSRKRGWYFVIEEDIAIVVANLDSSFIVTTLESDWEKKFSSMEPFNRSFGPQASGNVVLLNSENSVLECHQAVALKTQQSVGQFLMSLRFGSGFRNPDVAEYLAVHKKSGPILANPLLPVGLENSFFRWRSRMAAGRMVSDGLSWDSSRIDPGGAMRFGKLIELMLLAEGAFFSS